MCDVGLADALGAVLRRLSLGLVEAHGRNAQRHLRSHPQLDERAGLPVLSPGSKKQEPLDQQAEAEMEATVKALGAACLEASWLLVQLSGSTHISRRALAQEVTPATIAAFMRALTSEDLSLGPPTSAPQSGSILRSVPNLRLSASGASASGSTNTHNHHLQHHLQLRRPPRLLPRASLDAVLRNCSWCLFVLCDAAWGQPQPAPVPAQLQEGGGARDRPSAPKCPAAEVALAVEVGRALLLLPPPTCRDGGACEGACEAPEGAVSRRGSSTGSGPVECAPSSVLVQLLQCWDGLEAAVTAAATLASVALLEDADAELAERARDLLLAAPTLGHLCEVLCRWGAVVSAAAPVDAAGGSAATVAAVAAAAPPPSGIAVSRSMIRTFAVLSQYLSHLLSQPHSAGLLLRQVVSEHAVSWLLHARVLPLALRRQVLRQLLGTEGQGALTACGGSQQQGMDTPLALCHIISAPPACHSFLAPDVAGFLLAAAPFGLTPAQSQLAAPLELPHLQQPQAGQGQGQEHLHPDPDPGWELDAAMVGAQAIGGPQGLKGEDEDEDEDAQFMDAQEDADPWDGIAGAQAPAAAGPAPAVAEAAPAAAAPHPDFDDPLAPRAAEDSERPVSTLAVACRLLLASGRLENAFGAFFSDVRWAGRLALRHRGHAAGGCVSRGSLDGRPRDHTCGVAAAAPVAPAVMTGLWSANNSSGGGPYGCGISGWSAGGNSAAAAAALWRGGAGGAAGAMSPAAASGCAGCNSTSGGGQVAAGPLDPAVATAAGGVYLSATEVTAEGFVLAYRRSASGSGAESGGGGGDSKHNSGSSSSSAWLQQSLLTDVMAGVAGLIDAMLWRSASLSGVRCLRGSGVDHYDSMSESGSGSALNMSARGGSEASCAAVGATLADWGDWVVSTSDNDRAAATGQQVVNGGRRSSLSLRGLRQVAAVAEAVAVEGQEVEEEEMVVEEEEEEQEEEEQEKAQHTALRSWNFGFSGGRGADWHVGLVDRHAAREGDDGTGEVYGRGLEAATLGMRVPHRSCDFHDSVQCSGGGVGGAEEEEEEEKLQQQLLAQAFEGDDSDDEQSAAAMARDAVATWLSIPCPGHAAPWPRPESTPGAGRPQYWSSAQHDGCCDGGCGGGYFMHICSVSNDTIRHAAGVAEAALEEDVKGLASWNGDAAGCVAGVVLGEQHSDTGLRSGTGASAVLGTMPCSSGRGEGQSSAQLDASWPMADGDRQAAPELVSELIPELVSELVLEPAPEPIPHVERTSTGSSTASRLPPYTYFGSACLTAAALAVPIDVAAMATSLLSASGRGSNCAASHIAAAAAAAAATASNAGGASATTAATTLAASAAAAAKATGSYDGAGRWPTGMLAALESLDSEPDSDTKLALDNGSGAIVLGPWGQGQELQGLEYTLAPADSVGGHSDEQPREQRRRGAATETGAQAPPLPRKWQPVGPGPGPFSRSGSRDDLHSAPMPRHGSPASAAAAAAVVEQSVASGGPLGPGSACAGSSRTREVRLSFLPSTTSVCTAAAAAAASPFSALAAHQAAAAAHQAAAAAHHAAAAQAVPTDGIPAGGIPTVGIPTGGIPTGSGLSSDALMAVFGFGNERVEVSGRAFRALRRCSPLLYGWLSRLPDRLRPITIVQIPGLDDVANHRVFLQLLAWALGSRDMEALLLPLRPPPEAALPPGGQHHSPEQRPQQQPGLEEAAMEGAPSWPEALRLASGIALGESWRRQRPQQGHRYRQRPLLQQGPQPRGSHDCRVEPLEQLWQLWRAADYLQVDDLLTAVEDELARRFTLPSPRGPAAWAAALSLAASQHHGASRLVSLCALHFMRGVWGMLADEEVLAAAGASAAVLGPAVAAEVRDRLVALVALADQDLTASD